MKKLLFCILAVAIPAFGDIPVTPGVGKTVHTDTVNGLEYQAVKIIDGTTGGTSSAPVTSVGLKVDLSTTQVVGSLAHNGVASATNRAGILPAITQNAYGNNGSALTQGRDAAQMILTKSGLLGVWSGPDITFNSYSASTNTFTILNTTQDVTGLCGNAVNTVYVYSLRATCTQTTAGVIPVTVAKRSTAYSGAWSTMTATPQDSNYATMSSTAIFSTAAGLTNGTLVNYVDSSQIGCLAAATASPNDIYISPASWRMKPIVLRGATQCLGINLQNTSAAGAKFTASWEWMEVTSP